MSWMHSEAAGHQNVRLFIIFGCYLPEKETVSEAWSLQEKHVRLLTPAYIA